MVTLLPLDHPDWEEAASREREEAEAEQVENVLAGKTCNSCRYTCCAAGTKALPCLPTCSFWRAKPGAGSVAVALPGAVGGTKGASP